MNVSGNGPLKKSGNGPLNWLGNGPLKSGGNGPVQSPGQGPTAKAWPIPRDEMRATAPPISATRSVRLRMVDPWLLMTVIRYLSP